MLFTEIKFKDDKPLYFQIKIEIVRMIEEGMLVEGSKLPSTRELSQMLGISRNSCMHAYEVLEDEGYIEMIKGKGAFVHHRWRKTCKDWCVNWSEQINTYGNMTVDLDIVKNEAVTEKGMISFKSIAPDEKLFNLEQIRRNFLNSLSIDGEKLFNYGYARGYRPLLEFLKRYMESKGVNLKDKEILITNGFTEGFDIVLSALVDAGDVIMCENPTHNTAIKQMRLHNLKIIGADIEQGAINTAQLEEKLARNKIKLLYLTPSYHNPTGMVMTANKRKEVYELCKSYKVPIIEDGFNEELLYSSSHVSSIAALSGEDNSVIYIGSFSKIFFPGVRVGWIVADKSLISVLESVKRSRNIHSSVLDQAFLYEFLRSGDFETYLKKARRYYRDKYKYTIDCAKQNFKNCKVYGEGGLHIFVEMENVDARILLEASMKCGVIFMPGDIFYVDGKGKNTFRLGFSRVDFEEIKKGIEIIGQCMKEIE
jgi:DNA-binding transcriptional MocR family regulator